MPSEKTIKKRGFGGVTLGLTHSEKCKAAAKRRLRSVAPTPQQQKVYEAILNVPGKTAKEYSVLAFGTNFYFDRKRTDAAIRGLVVRSLVKLFAACHCGGELKPDGKYCHRCQVCGAIEANAHLKVNYVGLQE